jgi:hypothetical protein
MAHNIIIHKKISSIILCCCFIVSSQFLFGQDSANGKAKIVVTFVVVDSVKQVKATVTKPDNHGKDTAVKGVDVLFYIKKSFGLLPIGDAASTTDENGDALAEFPVDVPGDQSGNVTVIAKIEDNEKTGELETSQTTSWAVPTNSEHEDPKRALWASANNAPIPLVITVTSIVVLVWGIIIYILSQLIAIKKAGKYGVE